MVESHITVCRISLKVTRSTDLPNSASILDTITWHSNISEWHCNNITILVDLMSIQLHLNSGPFLPNLGCTRDTLFFLICTSSTSSLSSLSSITSGSQIHCPSAFVTVFTISLQFCHIIIHHLNEYLCIMNQFGYYQVKGEVIFFWVLALLETFDGLGDDEEGDPHVESCSGVICLLSCAMGEAGVFIGSMLLDLEHVSCKVGESVNFIHFNLCLVGGHVIHNKFTIHVEDCL